MLGAAVTLSVAALMHFGQGPTVDPTTLIPSPVSVAPPPAAPRTDSSAAPVAAIGDIEPTPARDTAQLAPEPTSATPGVAVQPPAPAPAPVTVLPSRPGRLFVNATPWGQLFIDGVLAGNTPRANLPLEPGRHSIRIVRYGYEPFERQIVVRPGQTIRLTDIELRARQ